MVSVASPGCTTLVGRAHLLCLHDGESLARVIDGRQRSLTPGFTSRYHITRLVYFEEFGEQPFMGGLGEHLVPGTAPSIVTDKADPYPLFFYRSGPALSS